MTYYIKLYKAKWAKFIHLLAGCSAHKKQMKNKPWKMLSTAKVLVKLRDEASCIKCRHWKSFCNGIWLCFFFSLANNTNCNSWPPSFHYDVQNCFIYTSLSLTLENTIVLFTTISDKVIREWLLGIVCYGLGRKKRELSWTIFRIKKSLTKTKSFTWSFFNEML